MARAPSKADLLRAQKTRLAALRARKHEEIGAVHKLPWWSEEYGIEYQTLKKAAGGERPLQPDDALTIAKYHGVSAQWVLFGVDPPTLAEADAPFAEDDRSREFAVPLLGYVRAGAEAVYLPLHENELDRIPAPPGATDKTRALEIRGDSLGELFDRWIVFFDDEQRPISPDLVNKLCIVALTDGRVLVKKIRRSDGAGYDLLSNTEKPIKNAQIKWAARVKHMAPR